MRQKQLGRSAIQVSAIGLGTWGMGGRLHRDTQHDQLWLDSLDKAMRAGVNFIDTAEFYGAGHTEEILGTLKAFPRDLLRIATKASPEHFQYDALIQAVERSLLRLQTDYIDLYQLNWPNPNFPLCESMAAMDKLVDDGKILAIGLSNYSLKQLQEAGKSTRHGVASVQVEYNLLDRTIENDLLPYCERNSISVIAYSPLDQGRRQLHRQHLTIIERIAGKHDKTPEQVILNWLASKAPVIPIPGAASLDHIVQNAAALDFEMDKWDLHAIETDVINRPVQLMPDQIIADKFGLDTAVPRPEELAEDFKQGGAIKPVHVIASHKKSGMFVLVEGKLRYWAWNIAHAGTVPVPALIRHEE
jgi:aryl-alcohol dehydrogenase-like predicted oxidoreductase